MHKIKYKDMNDEHKEYLEYLCLYSNDTDIIQKYVIENTIDINDVDLLKIICFRNNENILDLFVNKLNADFTIDNYDIIKYYSFIGDIDKLDNLIKKCNVNINKFINSSCKSTLTNSKKTIDYISNISI